MCVPSIRLGIALLYETIDLFLFFCTSEKVFERTVFKHIYNHFQDNNILTPLQSGFIPGDSTVNQLNYLYDSFS